MKFLKTATFFLSLSVSLSFSLLLFIHLTPSFSFSISLSFSPFCFSLKFRLLFPCIFLKPVTVHYGYRSCIRYCKFYKRYYKIIINRQTDTLIKDCQKRFTSAKKYWVRSQIFRYGLPEDFFSKWQKS